MAWKYNDNYEKFTDFTISTAPSPRSTKTTKTAIAHRSFFNSDKWQKRINIKRKRRPRLRSTCDIIKVAASQDSPSRRSGRDHSRPASQTNTIKIKMKTESEKKQWTLKKWHFFRTPKRTNIYACIIMFNRHGRTTVDGVVHFPLDAPELERERENQR